MISGRQALGSIDQALTEAHQQADRLQSEMAANGERMLALNDAQTEDYRGLARVRLDQLARDAMLEHLDHAERQATALLQQRNAALEALRRKVEDAVQRHRALEAQRAQQAALVDQAVARVDEAEAAIQVRLDAQPDYRAQRERAEEAGRMAAHANDKATRSEEERSSKGQAYHDDPLFMYLWRRQYGLPAYTASGLARWLDGKVARLIGYADARANFDRLNEIPVRLREHAQHQQGLADTEFERLRGLDEDARKADGIPALEQQVATQQARVDDIDRQIEQNEQEQQALQAEQARHAVGEDEHTQRAIEYLVNEFRRDDLSGLRDDAIRTPYPEDDVIVSRMLQREAERQQLEHNTQALHDGIAQQQHRVQELERLRVDFKRSRYDRSGSIFTDDSMLSLLLGQFLAGMLDRGMLWKALQELQRYQPRHSDPGFGSGGFGRGTVWNGGLRDLGDIIGGLGRGGFGGGSGGGFGNRGGGGGGGFRTGGGF